MYNKKMYTAGETIEIEKVFSTHPGKKRSKHTKPTPEGMKKYNERLAEDNFRRIINANFEHNDLHIVLTYRKNKRPPPGEAGEQLEKVIRTARMKYKKIGLDLKCVAVTGYTEDKDGMPEDEKHDEVAVHHHLIANYADIRIWTEIWKDFGRVWFFPLDNRGDYSQLANYIIRHSHDLFRSEDAPGRKRYRYTKNLIKPKPKEEAVQADSWTKDPKPLKGYFIDRDSIRYGVSEKTGYPYQFYRMIRIIPVGSKVKKDAKTEH